MPKLLVKGFDGPSETRELIVAHFAGEIKQFYLHQAQNHALGIVDQAAHRNENADRRLRYTNVAGRELVTIEVSLNVVERLIRKPDNLWDWALVELSIPNTSIAEGVFGAVISARKRLPPPKEAGLKFDGYAYDQGQVWPSDSATYWSDGADPFIISFAPRDAPAATLSVGDGSTQITSLLIDMRKLSSPIVEVELYGYLTMGGTTSYEITQYFRGAISSVNTIAGLGAGIYPTGWPYTGQDGYYAYFNLGYQVAFNNVFAPTAAYLSGLPAFPAQYEVSAPAPALTWVPNPASGVYVDSVTYHSSGLLTGLTEHVYLQNYPTAGVSSLSTTVHTFPITSGSSYVFTPAPAETRSAELRGIGGFGELQWVQTLVDAPNNQFCQWDLKAHPTPHVKTSRVANVQIASNYSDDSDLLRFLGVVLVDRVHHVIAFKSA